MYYLQIVAANTNNCISNTFADIHISQSKNLVLEIYISLYLSFNGVVLVCIRRIQFHAILTPFNNYP